MSKYILSNTSRAESCIPGARGRLGEFIELRLPKAVLRADGGLYYRGKFVLVVVRNVSVRREKARHPRGGIKIENIHASH